MAEIHELCRTLSGTSEIHAKVYLEKLKGRGRFRDLRVGGEMILKMNLKKECIRIWAELI
jgi:hypothetical protein